MSEWLSGNLGDIADIVMGQSPTGESVNTNGLGVPLLNGPTEFTIRYPKAVQFSTDPKRFSKVNDILFCVRGSTTGRMNWADEDYAIGRGLAAIRHKQGEEYRYFVKAILDYYLDTMLASASGSTFPNVSKDQLNELEISYPSFPEQKAIASILSSLDDKIDLLHRQNKTLEAMAETLFRQWFIEEAKEDWEEVTLADVCTRITDGSHSSPASVEDGYPMASVKDMYDWGINQSTCRKISKEDYEVLVQADCKALQGDILIAKDGSYLKHVFLMEESLDVVLLSSIAMLRPNGQYHPMLLTLFLKLDSTHELMQNIVTGAVIPRIVLKDFRKFPIQLPPKDLQDKAVKIVKPIFEKCWENNRQIQTLENLRDTLLPKLMSGEVRVQHQTEQIA
ncbi:restriction endonuclease subunit S [Acinetobacter tandoii]|uniref:Type I restriction enzyme, S subunit n=1 Tax=Acinetobacter tandoii DSM 14970 = CIP 107469 TaxID=1120927 RepID=R9B9U4_9GAMM|nr:restriction endonuclease subunit S [Acinetobacter tandoii]EOR11228.1 type I restriction enzyme, S subunit [Acinetobacter tandoii DSM 14970 = CIP 107469]